MKFLFPYDFGGICGISVSIQLWRDKQVSVQEIDVIYVPGAGCANAHF